MRLTRSFLPLAIAGIGASCGSIPNEPGPPPVGREIAPSGVMRGIVVYSGPHPCSKNGHIVGGAILFVFDRRLLPPPNGLGSTPVNFSAVTGDTLFANEPRNPTPDVYCPLDHGVKDNITANVPFAISPFPAGSFVIQSFYDYTGDFLPNFKFRNLPEMGDVGGGDIDTVDALKPTNAGNPNYQPRFLPVDIGMPDALPEGGLAGLIPNFTLPDTGFVADNLTVTVGAVLSTTRPYFYPGGMETSFDPASGAFTQREVQSSALSPTSLENIRSTGEKNPNFDPVLTIPQDIQVLAAPNQGMEPNVNNFESKFPRLFLHSGLPGKVEPPRAIAAPFLFQLPATGKTAGFNVWQNALFDATTQKWIPQDIPEGQGIPQLWPLVVLTKLIDDPGHTIDPASIKQQGSPTAPVVVIQGITLLGGDGADTTKPDTVYNTAQAEAFGDLFDTGSGRPTVFIQDHLTVVLRPAAICFDTLFDGTNPDKRGTIVTPHLLATTADLANPASNMPIVPEAVLMNPQFASLVKGAPIQACLPTGRYAVNVVYPDGQAWTVPNESGACSGDEGSTDYKKLTCTLKPGPILYSQGTRAVVEVVPATNPAHCTGASRVPAVCLPSAPP